MTSNTIESEARMPVWGISAEGALAKYYAERLRGLHVHEVYDAQSGQWVLAAGDEMFAGPDVHGFGHHTISFLDRDRLGLVTSNSVKIERSHIPEAEKIGFLKTVINRAFAHFARG